MSQQVEHQVQQALGSSSSSSSKPSFQRYFIFHKFLHCGISANTTADAGHSQLTRNRRRSIVGRKMMLSLLGRGVLEPRHEHEGLFVSGLVILTFDQSHWVGGGG